MNNIIVFATYWNEIEWIEASLAQIDKIDPVEAIICDGCFDPKHPKHSDDGTRQVIEKYVAGRKNVKLISPLRLSRLQHYIFWFGLLQHERSAMFTLAKLRTAGMFHNFNIYRLNQAATFNYMIQVSECFKPGLWFMTYDCDQFYSDPMLESFKCVNEDQLFSMLTAKEYTFFGDFYHYSESYETRDYNNMPHKIFNDTRFIPTRHPVRAINGRYKMYTDFEKKKDVGIYYHYHLKSPERMKAGYSLGDRKPPEPHHMETIPYKGGHPSIINKFFLS